ncbi:hypothetical protein phiFa_04 [Thermus phage phiFa]|nr:hypothetical protein phiFa_04 [Thermus phage phiFa]
MSREEALNLIEECMDAVDYALSHYTHPSYDKDVELALEDALSILERLREYVESCDGEG